MRDAGERGLSPATEPLSLTLEDRTTLVSLHDVGVTLIGRTYALGFRGSPR